MESDTSPDAPKDLVVDHIGGYGLDAGFSPFRGVSINRDDASISLFDLRYPLFSLLAVTARTMALIDLPNLLIELRQATFRMIS